MQTIAFFAGTCLVGVAQLASVAQTGAPSPDQAVAQIPHVIIAGLNQVRDKGPDEACNAWSKGSSWESEGTHAFCVSPLRSFQEEYGSYQGFDVIRLANLSPRIRVVYLALNYDKQPQFVKFVTYKTGDRWILLNLLFNLQEESLEPTPQ